MMSLTQVTVPNGAPLFGLFCRCTSSMSLIQTPLHMSSTGDTANSLTYRYVSLATLQSIFSFSVKNGFNVHVFVMLPYYNGPVILVQLLGDSVLNERSLLKPLLGNRGSPVSRCMKKT